MLQKDKSGLVWNNDLEKLIKKIILRKYIYDSNYNHQLRYWNNGWLKKLLK